MYSGVESWSTRLREAGYDLSYLGKWHVSAARSPAAFGWREASSDVAIDLGQAGLRNKTLSRVKPGWPQSILCGATTVSPEQLSDAQLTDRAIGIIEGAATSHTPFAICIGYMSAHAPYIAPEPYLGLYSNEEMPVPSGYGDDLTDKPNIYRRLYQDNWSHLSWPEMDEVIRHRYALLTYLDAQVGRIAAALDRTDQTTDTAIIYTSDHGDYGGSHGLFNLGVPAFDQAYNVPLLISWPAGISAKGRDCDAFVTHLDIGATISDIAGIPGMPATHGRSLMPFLTNARPDDWRDDFYGEFLGHESLYSQRQIRTRSSKFVWNSFDFDELYDLSADPNECINLIDDPNCEGMRRSLIERLWRRSIEYQDITFSSYPMNGILPYGPDLIDSSASWSWMP